MPPGVTLDPALAWAARGFAVFPIREDGKEPALKGSWRDVATRDPERIRRLWNRSYNIGVDTEGLIVVDIDNKNGKTGSLDWELFGFPDDTLTIETPSGGFHLYYRGEASSQPPLTKSIDIRAASRGYVLAPGSVIGGKPYKILKDLPLAEAPKPLVEHCKERRVNCGNDSVAELDTDEAIERATDFLQSRRPAVERQNGDLWTLATANNVIDFGISADMCHELMAEHWNDRCSPPWELEGPASLRTKCDSAWKTRTLPAGTMAPEEEFRAAVIPPIEHKPRGRPKVMWAGDPALDLSQQWLMFNRFPRVGTAMLVGPSGGGKTFLSLDLGVALAEGRDWLGKPGDEKVGTIILSAEGIGGLPARMKALNQVPVVARSIGLINSEQAAKELIETITDLANQLRLRFSVRLGLIVIDTLTAAGLLANENDNSEIGRAIKVVEQMALSFGCLVLVTHHPPKHGTGARGGYALHAGFDTIVEIFHESGKPDRYVECTKGRDAPIGEWGSFKLERCIVEPDNTGRGRDITTQRVVYGTERREKGVVREPSRDRQEKFFDAFENARAELALVPKVSPVPLQELKNQYLVLAKRWKNAEQSFMDTLRWAKENERVKLTYVGVDAFVLESLAVCGEGA